MDAKTKETDNNVLVLIIAVIVGAIVIIILVIAGVYKIQKSRSRSTQTTLEDDTAYDMQGTENGANTNADRSADS